MGGKRALRLYKTRTINELAGMFEGIPTIKKPGEGSGLQMYSPANRALSNDLAQAIQWHMDDKRRAQTQQKGEE